MHKVSKSLKVLAKEFDSFARAQYVAGRMGYPQSAADNPSKLFRSVQPLWNLSNLVAKPKFNRGEIVEEWVSSAYSGILEPSIKVIQKYLINERFVYSGISAEDVLLSIIGGYTPLKGFIQTGGPRLYEFGSKSAIQQTLYSISSTAQLLSLVAKSVCESVLNSAENTQAEQEFYLDNYSEPIMPGEEEIEYWMSPSFKMKSRKIIDENFRGDWIKKIWYVITENPDLIGYSANEDTYSIDAIETAKAINKEYGIERDLDKVYITFVGGQWRKYRDEVIELLRSSRQQGKLAKTVNVQLKARELESLVWALESAIELYTKLDRPDISGFNKKRIKELLYELQKRAIEL